MKKFTQTWDDVLSSVARLQEALPQAVVVGGTAAAIHASHRMSYDYDHVLTDLVEHFDEIRNQLESVSGWKTGKKPVPILGNLDGIETGVWPLIRSKPLETVDWPLDKNRSIRLPKPEEVLRIKATLTVKRNAMRDYVDAAAMADWLEHNEKNPAEILAGIGDYYDNENELKQEIVNRFASPLPFDLDLMELKSHKDIKPPLNDWKYIKDRLRKIGTEIVMLDLAKEPKNGMKPRT